MTIVPLCERRFSAKITELKLQLHILVQQKQYNMKLRFS